MAKFPNRAKYHVATYSCGHFAESGDAAHHASHWRDVCGLCNVGTNPTVECPPGCSSKLMTPRRQVKE